MTHPPDLQFSEYLDGALPPAESAALEAHCADCQPCRLLLADLRRVLARAQALEDRAPREDLWPGVAAAIGAAPRGRRRVSFSLPELAAAGVALMLLSGGAVAVWLRPPKGAAPLTSAAGVATDTGPVAASHSTRGYDAAIRRLEQELARSRGRLDTVTIRVVEQKLALIDRAIVEADRALATDSSSPYLRRHLARTRQQKLDLLRHATAISLQ
jgi:hypothetical protein